MNAIGRYIVRTSLGAFLMILGSLTAVIWVTHALRDIDLVTNQGQTVVVFVGITLLLVPALVLVIAPLALVIAIAYTLNKLNTDSEIIVMNAAGMSPWRVLMPFMTVALIVSLMVGTISAYLAPKSLRELRTLLTRVRADLVANLLQPGRFTSLEGNRLTFHIRERQSNGELAGIFIDDRRDPNEHVTVMAQRGQTVENENGTFLVLDHGSIHRQETKSPDPTIVVFERYVFDLSAFTGADVNPTFNVTERYLWDLADPDPNDAYYKANAPRFRSELHDRTLAPFYPLVFTLVTFAILGAPRTSRESRSTSMIMAIVTVTAVRIVGFACIVFATRAPGALAVMYISLIVSTGVALLVISRGTIVEPPAWLTNGIKTLQSRLTRRPVTA